MLGSGDVSFILPAKVLERDISAPDNYKKILRPTDGVSTLRMPLFLTLATHVQEL